MKDAAFVGPRAEDRLFTPNYVFATVANLFNAFGQQTITATLPVYVLALGGSQAEAGLVSGTMAFTALILRPLIGWLADTWRRRPLVLIGTSCYGLASIVYLLAGSVPALALGRVVHGYGLCNYTTAAAAYITDIAPPKRRAEAIGFFAAAGGVGMISGPAIGFFIIALLGFHALFAVTAGVAFAAFAISFLAREGRAPRPEKRQPWTLRNGIVAVEALPATWTAFCLGLGFGPLGAFVAIFATSRGIGNPGLYFTAQAATLILSRAFAGRLADRLGRAWVIGPGVVATALALGLLPTAYDFPHFMLSAALFGLGFGAAQPATIALLADRVRPERRGLAMSTYFLGFDSGISFGSMILGVVSEAWGFGVMWPISATCVLLGLLGLMVPRPQLGLDAARG